MVGSHGSGGVVKAEYATSSFMTLPLPDPSSEEAVSGMMISSSPFEVMRTMESDCPGCVCLILLRRFPLFSRCHRPARAGKLAVTKERWTSISLHMPNFPMSHVRLTEFLSGGIDVRRTMLHAVTTKPRRNVTHILFRFALLASQSEVGKSAASECRDHLP